MAREWDVSVARAGEQTKAEAVVKATKKRVKRRELDDDRAEEARLRQEEVVKAKEAARAVAEAERDRLVAEVKGCADGPGAVAVAEKVVEAARMVVELEREVAACAAPVEIGGWQVCKWGSGLLKSRLCFLTSKNHKQDYKQRGTTTWG